MNKLHYIIFGGIVALFALGNCLFFVDQRQSAVVFQFGEAMRTIEKPGLSIKIPFIQKVEFFEKRLLHVNAEAKELTAIDGKRIIIDAFAKFIISNPIMFYKTVHDYQGVQIRLNKILESSMRKAIGRVALTALLTGERSKIMQDICAQVNAEAKDFGINVVDVRILRADLPQENSAAIYRRMVSERTKEANQIRAEGREESERIQSKADKESSILLADAYKNAQVLKGEGDSAAAKILNVAYSVDPDFFKFYKSLAVYQATLQNKASFVISPDAEFLKYLNLGSD
jgi:modulator of FtsH protease HflC